MAAVSAATLGLPTNIDERQLFGHSETALEIADRWRSLGCDEVIVKAGEQGCFFVGPSQETAFPAQMVQVIDSSGAGDAFNAGFLQARLRGAELSEAVGVAQAIARETLGHLGAIRIVTLY